MTAGASPPSTSQGNVSGYDRAWATIRWAIGASAAVIAALVLIGVTYRSAYFRVLGVDADLVRLEVAQYALVGIRHIWPLLGAPLFVAAYWSAANSSSRTWRTFADSFEAFARGPLWFRMLTVSLVSIAATLVSHGAATTDFFVAWSYWFSLFFIFEGAIAVAMRRYATNTPVANDPLWILLMILGAVLILPGSSGYLQGQAFIRDENVGYSVQLAAKSRLGPNWACAVETSCTSPEVRLIEATDTHWIVFEGEQVVVFPQTEVVSVRYIR